ncbi:hypothetical protein BTO20_14850 [Mycobacterium dioxanotrophicus]|uniref:Uncharacterized protein n=1 Tax=Mycobacterium dioxanotrophicus TaxID=482462 RepID=A0A1Y0C3D4_9MYCO|nr:hypothetical protein [Mycobacterium dioxanotrophicus]ART69698.1 hypothetical protein BTO20_14850 [Mycobacterium dioxanotrophicus]
MTTANDDTWCDLTDVLTNEQFQAIASGHWFGEFLDRQQVGGASLYGITRRYADGRCERRIDLVALDAVHMTPAQARELADALHALADKADSRPPAPR